MRNIPFAMIYQEEFKYGNDNCNIIYDEELDLNVKEINGQFIPLIMLNDISLRTKTITEVRGESMDDDPYFCASFIGTETMTKASGESTDSD